MNVEVWSDIACPWCYVGKRRLEVALAAFEPRDEVTVTWRSFELDPRAPRERDVDVATLVAQKYGWSRDEALARQRQMNEVAAGDGIAMRSDIARSGNTFDAHRLLALAAERGLQDAVKERFMRAQHCEGASMGDPATLERLAVEAGLDREQAREVLAGNRYAAEVRDDERVAAALGINAVPFFVVDRAFGASGAQPPELLGQMLQRAWDARVGQPAS